MEEHKARQFQEQRQQGLGRTIVSTEFKGHRVVAVGNRIFTSDKWKTFHDFLLYYVREPFGKDWWMAEIEKDGDDAHPVILWAKLTHQWQRATDTGERIKVGRPNGAAMAYLRLGYDLYSVAHNHKVEEKLVGRLKDRNQFWGARYELWVAAVLFRAGFEVEFIDENDRSTTHCEFIATHKRSGRRFSVEAKFRAGTDFRLGRHLCRALKKHADFDRMVFIDINAPGLEPLIVNGEPPTSLASALNSIRKFEGRRIDGKPLPPAYVVLTNQPNHHHLADEDVPSGALLEGFQIPDCKKEAEFLGLRAALAARALHQEMFDLAESLKEHQAIPATFDGEIEEFAFSPSPRRFLVGKPIEVNVGGKTRLGELTSGMVTEKDKTAHLGIFFPEDGTAEIHTAVLSDEEFSAWKRYPETFFGVVRSPGRNISDPVEAYDFFFSSYKATPKERLLELMAGSSDLDNLAGLPQEELAREYSIRCAEFVFSRRAGAAMAAPALKTSG